MARKNTKKRAAGRRTADRSSRGRAPARKRETRRNHFVESLRYIRETLNYVYLIIAVFFLSSLVSFFFPGGFSFFDELLRELGGRIEGMGLLELTWFIFQNNVSSAFVGMILGLFLGVVPVVNALTNGALLGYVYSLASAEGGYGVIWYLIPHGIFELPAVFISLGLGVRFGMFVFARKGEKKKEFLSRFWSSLKAFLYIVLPLLVIAAIIEGVLIFFS